MVIGLGYLLIFVPSEKLYSQHNKLSPDSCPFQLHNDQAISVDIEDVMHSIPSPNGKKLLLTNGKYAGIWIHDIRGGLIKEISNKKMVGYNADWAGLRNDAVTYKEVLDSKLKERIRYISDDAEKSNFSANSNKPSDIQLKYNIKTETVEARSEKTNSTWNVTSTPGFYYRFVISPDDTEVLIHKNDGKMYIYDLYGGGLLREIGYGLCKSWSPDGKYLIYFIDEDLGQHYIVKSEIYICNANGDKHWNLTKTNNKIEMWPHWSKGSNVISYFEQTDSSIHVAELKKIEN